MIGIDLFAGAGGMTIGAKQAGVDVKFAVESNPAACDTYAHNNQSTQLFSKDIRTLKQVPVRRPRKQSMVVFGGPPCQGFSTSNRRTRNKLNDNNWLFQEFLRTVQLIKPLPEWVVFENVRGFSETENGLFLEYVLQKLSELGYTVSYDILNSVNFGVPQKRRRFFAVASIDGIKAQLSAQASEPFVTVNCALADLPFLEVGATENWRLYADEAKSNYAKLLRGQLDSSANHQVTRNSALVVSRYRHIPPGGNWQSIPGELMNNYTDPSRCHTGIYYRLKSDEPSIVIGNFRKNMLIHPTQHRGLSVREAARIQSFPDNYEFKGSIGFQQQQVGNAVPPLLAQAVFEIIIRASA